MAVWTSTSVSMVLYKHTTKKMVLAIRNFQYTYKRKQANSDRRGGQRSNRTIMSSMIDSNHNTLIA